MSFRFILCLALIFIAACSDQKPADSPGQSAASQASANASTKQPAHSTTTPSAKTEREDAPRYWGVEPGEPLPITWEDLLPEGALEIYFAQTEEFYAELDQQLKAGAVRLSEADPLAKIEEGSAQDVMPQFGTFDAVEDLDGQLIRMPGYIVPLEFTSDDMYAEFLFVPYMGACLHMPPPPPNQVIYVRAENTVQVPDIWTAYWLEGNLRIERHMNDLGNAAYSLDLTRLEPYPVPG